ncbi:MAG: hypothetical protein ACKO1F_18270 [Flammeovirgaceae bacterium]
MKTKFLLFLILSVSVLKAQDIPKQNFQQAYEEISSMLDGKQPLDFEKAVFFTENAYRDNAFSYEEFKTALDIHSTIIGQLIKASDRQDWKQFVKGKNVTHERELEAKERYRKALANWAIFTYLTDTVELKLGGQQLSHLPYTYSNSDPFGTADWRNSQTIHLLETQKGNCYALVTLFKIFSDRFTSEANIVTAPQHIYIEHRDPNGNRFNVEVATRSFPDMGSIQTLTHTTREALLNDISMRKLDLKQSVGLCLVYLAKGYEYKSKIKDDEFLLTCANTALQHDPKNLNALLLKAQVYEQRVMKNEMPAAAYETMLADLYKLGYRQMPDDMKEIMLSKIQGRPAAVIPTNKTPNPFSEIGEPSRYVTLSGGLFEELYKPQKIVKYGQTIFDTEKGKVVKFLDDDISSYQVDPVVFALSVDPLTKSYPWYTPYQFAGNKPIIAIDLDGLEPKYVINEQGRLTKPMIALLSSAYSGHNSDWDKGVLEKSQWLKDDDLKGSGTLAFTRRANRNTVYFNPEFDEEFSKGYKEDEKFRKWVEIISHKEYHRMQFENWPLLTSIVITIHDAFASYENHVLEATAYEYGAPLMRKKTMASDLLLSRGEDIFKIITSSALSEEQKTRDLTVIGLEFRLNKLDEQESEWKARYEKSGAKMPTRETENFAKERQSINSKIKSLKSEKENE